MSKQQYTLYWDRQHAIVLAAEMEPGSEYTFDGAHREMQLIKARNYPYGSIEICSSYESSLPYSKILCSIVPTHPPCNTALELLDKNQTLILDQTDEPLAQALRYLNMHKDTGGYRMDIERRVLHDSALYGKLAEFVAMAGSWPGEIQWCYHGTDEYHDCWESEEQLPIEEMFHRHLTNQHRVYWVLEKRPNGIMKYRYYARKHTWQIGWHGADTPEQLATLIEQKEFLHS